MEMPPDTISCVECGGAARLVSLLPRDEPVEPGTPLAYTCPDCYQRLDIVWDSE